ncbi:hypothetical protein FIE12Z_10686 [Fusarium flagelliforme]|uniref:Uncharacterized protein n=1 Tax=Fusarium flagelliforme TaxID=2675880 RepID=A0A395MB39_9HYPO|nr:hypothetical protein FIE12Z_10686 [Fusarium flagelliforme]
MSVDRSLQLSARQFLPFTVCQSFVEVFDNAFQRPFFAIGLFITDSTLAGPCKPRTSASEEVTATSVATSETTTTVLETSTDVVSETATTVTTSATTTAVDINLTTSETETSTAIDFTTVADTTTIAETSAVAETTTTAPGPIATYSLRASGSPIDGATPQGSGQQGNSIIFNPNFSGVVPRTYAIEPSTGRLQDTDTGRYVCAYYGSSRTPSVPAMVANCRDGDDKRYNFMTCKAVNGLLSCTASRGFCVTDDETDEVTCITTPGVNDQFYYRYSPNGGDYWYVGSASDIPAGYTPINVAATKL